MNIKKFFSLLIGAFISMSVQAQSKPEIFTDFNHFHVDPVIPHPTKVVITPAQLKDIVETHKLIGKEFVEDCLDKTNQYICLDEFISYFPKEKIENLKFRIVKENEFIIPDEYFYRITIYLDKNNKIKEIKRL